MTRRKGIVLNVAKQYTIFLARTVKFFLSVCVILSYLLSCWVIRLDVLDSSGCIPTTGEAHWLEGLGLHVCMGCSGYSVLSGMNAHNT